MTVDFKEQATPAATAEEFEKNLDFILRPCIMSIKMAAAEILLVTITALLIIGLALSIYAATVQKVNAFTDRTVAPPCITDADRQANTAYCFSHDTGNVLSDIIGGLGDSLFKRDRP